MNANELKQAILDKMSDEDRLTYAIVTLRAIANIRTTTPEWDHEHLLSVAILFARSALDKIEERQLTEQVEKI